MIQRFFSEESEAERRALWAQVRVGSLHPSEAAYLTFHGSYALPLTLPDGIRGVIDPDSHAPAQNRRIMHARHRFDDWFRPHIRHNIGDYSDMYAMSRWPKHPRTPNNPQWEVEESARFLRQGLGFGKPFWTLVDEGNHDNDRVLRNLIVMCPGIANFLDPVTRNPITALVNMMGFSNRDAITFLAGADERGGYEGGVLINDDLKLEHGTVVKPIPGDSVKTTAEDHMQSTGMGHTHRLGMFAREVDGGVLRGYEIGCQLDWDHPFFAYAHGQHNWHHGFAVYHVFGGKVHVQIIPIMEAPDDVGQLHYWFTYAGRTFRSSDR